MPTRPCSRPARPVCAWLEAPSLTSRAVRRCLLALLVVPIVAGCGHPVSTDARGNVLTVYASSALNGAQSKTGLEMLTGEKLALGLHRAAVGILQVKLVARDSAGGTDSGFVSKIVANNAQAAVNDSSTIGYLGETVPRATRVALPILSAASISVISPGDPDPQLTAPAGTVPGNGFMHGVRTGYSLAALTDAQIFKLAGPRFPAAFRRTFGGRPTAATARGYVAMTLLLDALKAAGPKQGGDRKGVATALGPVVARALASAGVSG
jgi:ABC-type branched-subunit amino acid transport system substrate-binding protein